MLTDDGLASLRDHRFPGGVAVVEHWENWLLTDCTQRAPLPGGTVHPIAMFHVPLRAVGVTIGELFAIGGAAPTPGAVTLLGYEWSFAAPLREGVEYLASGGVSAAVREVDAHGAVMFDDVDFAIDLTTTDGAFAARAVNHWRFRHAAAPHTPVTTAHVDGTPLPTLDVVVDAARMKTMAALLRDPYPIHWDPEASIAAGYGGRTINQGPLNAGYLANMLAAWAGPAALRRLSVTFHGRALADDRLVAGGVLLDGSSTECALWLDRPDDGARLVSGTATIDPH